MEFLPIEINNEKVYAGFWKRLGSAIVDILVFSPFFFVFHLVESSSLLMAMISTVLSGLLFSAYSIYFHYKFGATLGKMAVGIKVTLPNGENIGIKQAFLRSSVDLAFAVFAVAAQVVAILNANTELYLNAGLMERFAYIVQLSPAWYGFVSVAAQLWFWGELIVLLFNKRKRALHDFIAGTVVIRQEYAEQCAQPEAADLVTVS